MIWGGPERRHDRGFTLIELLVVVIILGIVSGVVVFAVRGMGSKGDDEALAIDKRTIRTAQEAFCARYGRYATTEDELVNGPADVPGAKGFLSEHSELHGIEEVGPQETDPKPCNGTGYRITGPGSPPPPDAGDEPALVQGTWRKTGPPHLPIRLAARLDDGRIMVQVGTTGREQSFALYDPAADTWTPTPPAPHVLVDDVWWEITPLVGGDAAVRAGPITGAPDPVFEYRAKEMLWEVTEDMDDHRRWEPSVVLLRGTEETCGDNCGKVLYAGGTGAIGDPANPFTRVPNGGTIIAKTYQLYDPGTNRLKMPGDGIGFIPMQRQDADRNPTGELCEQGADDCVWTLQRSAAVQLRDGRVVARSFGRGAAWIYDPIKHEEAWEALPPSPKGVGLGTGGSGELLADGRVIFAGGKVNDDAEHVALFDPALHEEGEYPWLKVANCPAEGGQRRCGRMAAVPDGAGGKGKLLALNLSEAGAKRVKVWQLDLNSSAAQLEKATAWAPLPDLPAPGLTATLITGTPAQCGTNCNKVLVGGPEGAFIWDPANAP